MRLGAGWAMSCLRARRVSVLCVARNPERPCSDELQSPVTAMAGSLGERLLIQISLAGADPQTHSELHDTTMYYVCRSQRVTRYQSHQLSSGAEPSRPAAEAGSMESHHPPPESHPWQLGDIENAVGPSHHKKHFPHAEDLPLQVASPLARPVPSTSRVEPRN